MILALTLIVVVPAAVAATLVGWSWMLRPPPPPPSELERLLARWTANMNALNRQLADVLEPGLRRFGAAVAELGKLLAQEPRELSTADRRALRCAGWLRRIDGGRR